MKKEVACGLLGLVVLTSLAACSAGKKSTDSTSIPSSVSGFAVGDSILKEETTPSSSFALKDSTVTYLTDEEIANVQTIGDFRGAYQALSSSYLADFDELIAQTPKFVQDQLNPYKEQEVQNIDKQKAELDAQLATIGDDTTLLSEESREDSLNSLRTTRDQFKQSIAALRDQVLKAAK